MQKTILTGLHFYQRAISPMLAPRCRFYPTCSAYAIEAVGTHGATRGSWLTVKRLAKCHPLHPGGVDLVPTAQVTDRVSAAQASDLLSATPALEAVSTATAVNTRGEIKHG